MLVSRLAFLGDVLLNLACTETMISEHRDLTTDKLRETRTITANHLLELVSKMKYPEFETLMLV